MEAFKTTAYHSLAENTRDSTNFPSILCDCETFFDKYDCETT